MMHRLRFLAEFIKDPRTVGSIVPSSRSLVEKMLKPIDFSKAECIVELGAGTGCITKALLRRMGPDSTLLSFETKKEFCAKLERIGDDRLHVINDSAENIAHYVRKNGYKKADYIVSGLPLVVLPKSVQDNILFAVHHSLAKDGAYIQFQYSLTSYKRFRKEFASVELDYTLMNIPPAAVYVCRTTKYK